MTSVRYGMKYTRNLGNFENAVVFYEVEDEVRKGENIDQAKERITNKVDGWVQDRVEQIDREAANR